MYCTDMGDFESSVENLVFCLLYTSDAADE